MKKIIILVFLSILLTGCVSKKFTLDDVYYNKNVFLEVDSKEIENKLKMKESFILFTYNPYCNFKVSCDEIFKNFAINNNVEILKIPFEDFKNTRLYKKIKYAPSIILINKGEVIDYLDPNKDDDLDMYQDEEKVNTWIREFVNLKN